MEELERQDSLFSNVGSLNYIAAYFLTCWQLKLKVLIYNSIRPLVFEKSCLSLSICVCSHVHSFSLFVLCLCFLIPSCKTGCMWRGCWIAWLIYCWAHFLTVGAFGTIVDLTAKKKWTHKLCICFFENFMLHIFMIMNIYFEATSSSWKIPLSWQWCESPGSMLITLAKDNLSSVKEIRQWRSKKLFESNSTFCSITAWLL